MSCYAALPPFASRQGTESYHPIPDLPWRIPELICQMTGVAHMPDIRVFILAGQKGTEVGPLETGGHL